MADDLVRGTDGDLAHAAPVPGASVSAGPGPGAVRAGLPRSPKTAPATVGPAVGDQTPHAMVFPPRALKLTVSHIVQLCAANCALRTSEAAR